MLEANVELDRREFRLFAAFTVAAGFRLRPVRPIQRGKTTILEVIAGLLEPARGAVVLDGRVLTRTAEGPRRQVPPWQRRVGLLRQDPGAVPAPVGPAEPGLRGPDQARARRDRPGLRSPGSRNSCTDIGGLLDDRPARLSGGQAHRVALGGFILPAGVTPRCCWTSPTPGWTPASGATSLTWSASWSRPGRCRPCWWPTSSRLRRRSRTRWRSSDHGQIRQTGTPAEVVAAPAARRVAELVGYRSFVPLAGAAEGVVASVHREDRVVAGRQPGRGLVLSGPVRSGRPSRGWVGVTIETAGTLVPAQLREPPGGEPDFTFTVLDPPCFGPDGLRVRRPEEVAT